MKSFRTELENPRVEQDIIELEEKIRLFHAGKVDEERFRSLRLARGVYGQRQPGVQMIRIKLPYGKLTRRQLLRICEVTDTYSTGKMHLTTRQDIQIHYVSLDQTPALWAELERDDVTLREACGNTVRNVTASALAGVDPAEPFDVTPYAHAFFSYFLRNPICQEMGRKFKVSFSSSEADTAFGYLHDLGFIPRIVIQEGEAVEGFQVLIGGGLGAQPIPAQEAYSFLPGAEIIPFAAAVLRLFDRHGERNKRFKARFKFLLKSWGLVTLLEQVEAEKKALPQAIVPIAPLPDYPASVPPEQKLPAFQAIDSRAFEQWQQSNVVAQKQAGLFAVKVRVPLGDFTTQTGRKLAQLLGTYAADDLRISVNQGLVFRGVRAAYLPYFFHELQALGLGQIGADSTGDITACPGTDTCNLGISSSTGITRALERVIEEEYPEFLQNQTLKIKISGCMNGCGQHSIAGIGFHGSSLKVKGKVAPALQVLLGGVNFGAGQARFAEKVIKIPSRRGPGALRILFDDYTAEREFGEAFHQYYARKGKAYFYQLLKGLAQVDDLSPQDFIDWGKAESFEPAIGVGECAGVVIDLVATLLLESEEKLEKAQWALEGGAFADSLYHSYAALVNSAKAWLLQSDHVCNTQAGIIRDFDTHFSHRSALPFSGSFSQLVYQIREQEPNASFATLYLSQAKAFLHHLQSIITSHA